MSKSKKEGYKNRNVLQWTKTPCGTEDIIKKEGTKEYFQELRKNKYVDYAPWLLKAIRAIDVKDKKLLEIGCGAGTDLLEFAKRGAKCYAVDLTPKHIELTKKLFRHNGLSVKAQIQDATALKFKERSFDVIYSHGVLHHIPNIHKVLNEIYRVLKKGGKAYLMVYHKRSFDYCKMLAYHGIMKRQLLRKKTSEIISEVVEANSTKSKPYVRVYAIEEFRKELCMAGFSVEKIYLKHIWDEKRIKIFKKLISSAALSLVEKQFGWYIIAEVKK